MPEVEELTWVNSDLRAKVKVSESMRRKLSLRESFGARRPVAAISDIISESQEVK